MPQKEISIVISPTGEVTFTVNGVKGKACLAETKFLEDALGGKVVSQEPTDEYYEEPDLDTVSTSRKY